MNKYLRSLLYISALFLSSCSLFSVDDSIVPSQTLSKEPPEKTEILVKPSATQPLKYTNTPTEKPNTATPTCTQTNTKTITPTHDSHNSACDHDNVLLNLKSVPKYSEFEIGFNVVNDISTLFVWFVDPAINQNATADSVFDNFVIAADDAVALSIELLKSSDCVDELFTYVNPIVVDQNYNGWFSANIPISALNEYIAGRKDTGYVIDALQEGAFFRHEPPQPTSPGPESSCTWSEARDNIQEHFDPNRQNVNFYLVKQESGETNLFAQWDGPGDETSIAAMFNVAMEIDCLHPSVDIMIITFVDMDGIIQSVWTWPPKNPLENPELTELEIYDPNDK